MDHETTIGTTFGLRHVLEDGVAVVEGRLPDPSRSEFVLGDLDQLLQSAARGVEMTERRQLFVRPSDVMAIEAYALIFRYLDEIFGGELSNQIAQTSTTLSKLKRKEAVADLERTTVSNFLKELLTRLHRDDVYGQPIEPMQIGS